MNLSEQQIEKLKSFENADELRGWLVAEGLDVDEEQARRLFELNEFTSLEEEDLKEISGGCDSSSGDPENYRCDANGCCPRCHSMANSRFLSSDTYAIDYHCDSCDIDWFDPTE